MPRYESLAEMQQRIADIEKAKLNCQKPDYMAGTAERARKRMERVDAFPSEVRAVIHDYSLEVVQEFWNHGVKRAKSMRHLIETVLHGELPDGNPRFAINRAKRAKANPLSDTFWDDDEPLVLTDKGREKLKG